MMDTAPEKAAGETPLRTMVRDVAVLQVKLIVDGFRDLVLVPASLIAGIVSVARSKDGRPGHEFYTLISLGKQSERWINLFGAIRNAPPEIIEETRFGEADIDEIVSRVESFVVDEYQRGGVTAQARERIQKAMAAMQRRRRSGEEEPNP